MNDSAEPKLGKVLEFMRLLWAVDHGLQRVSKRMLSEHGVTGLQRMMIRIVHRFPGIAAGQLATILHVHPSTLTGALEKLVRTGALKRKPDPEDARRSRLSMGPKGKTIDAIRTGTVEAAVRRALTSVSQQTLASAEEVLRAIARELESDDEE